MKKAPLADLLKGGATPVYGDSPIPAGAQTALVVEPLFIAYRTPRDTVEMQIHMAPGDTHKHYGLLVCDLVRHVARAFKVPERDVWEWVDKERRKPTTEIKEGRGVN